MTISISDATQARKELARLTDIETKLRTQIVTLRSKHKDHKSAESWARFYTERLRHNVRPAIGECLSYLKAYA